MSNPCVGNLQRRPHVMWTIIVLSTGMLLLIACGSAAIPQAALENVEARAFRKLRTEDVSAYVDGFSGRVELVIGEARLKGGALERRAYLTFQGYPPVYLGPLTPQLADVPLETLFVDVGGDRFVIAWVDESILGTPTSVVLGRPVLQPVDDSMNTLRVGAAVNRVAILPIAAAEALLWPEVSEARVQTRSEGFVWQRQFDPPVFVEHLFQIVVIP